jgi:hypothetical protein
MIFGPRTDSFPGLVGRPPQTGAANLAGVLVAYLLSVPMENVHLADLERALRVDNGDSEQYLVKV